MMTKTLIRDATKQDDREEKVMKYAATFYTGGRPGIPGASYEGGAPKRERIVSIHRDRAGAEKVVRSGDADRVVEVGESCRKGDYLY